MDPGQLGYSFTKPKPNKSLDLSKFTKLMASTILKIFQRFEGRQNM